ncbi:n2,N2-dimethylguanosine tRNA methyltransferase [Hirsutella rhossiliensis]|uniref:tRNA (guanine(26)-N(2))-dimethyltransferase n=1 Tax=Hirsutella rhossiliensis TaxID=111463 RepID=A0A9P8N175_9HYPO|nr:n2,N2-dimethylguanosine tRNA methyltransferase domain-containing protein [Hirsutella rhossiliensis]KAH0965788.1 n2,N2-dimethylguanosine tRNA methyltransferase domain-containing protein [Hirsutella rhossiliensis]
MADSEAPVDVVEQDGKQFRPIKEGKATILVPLTAKADKNGASGQQVFYNPIQQYNRDLSILAIKAYGEWALERRPQGQRPAKHGKKRKRGHEDPAPAPAPAPGPEPQSESGLQENQAAAVSQPDKSQQPLPAKEHKPSFKILDALSASGLRALRYAHELPFVTSVTANDLSASAAASIRLNVEHNGVQDIVAVTNQDALALITNKFDVVDLDPYGSAAPFFDAAIQSVRFDGGLLCITCTDSAVWAGHSYCEKTFALYGGIPVKGMHAHEAGLRLILSAVATAGAKYGLAIEPLLSLSIDFYTKLFIRVSRSPQAVKFLPAKSMVVYSCDQGCGAWETQPLLKSRPAENKKGSGFYYKHGMALGPTADRFCQHCGFKTHLSGPMYAGHIHSQEFIQRILDEIPKASPEVYKTLARLEGMLRTALEEFIPGPEPPAGVDPKEAELATVDHYPFFVVPGKVSSVVSCATPNDDLFRGALMHLGYRVGRSHCRAGSIKTDAPWSTIWWVIAEWIRQRSPVKTSKFKPPMAGWKILHDAGLLGQQGEGAGECAQKSEEKESLDMKMEEDEKESSDLKMKDDKKESGDAERKGAEDKEQQQVKEGQEPSEAMPNESDLRKTLVFNDALARLGRQRDSQRYVRYQMNPQRNWGPMTRAKAN